MTRQALNRGTVANDGTGDSLRQMAQKVNENFVDIYKKFGGDSDVLAGEISMDSDGILFHSGSFRTKLTKSAPTTNRTITLPDASGTVILDSAGPQTLTDKTLISPLVVLLDLVDSAGSNGKYAVKVPKLDSDFNVNFPTLSDSDEITFNTVTQTLENKTLLAPTITIPKITGELQDSAGNGFLSHTPTGSAVNHINITNAATGNGPILSPRGTDSDIDLRLQSKNGGAIRIEDKLVNQHEFITASGSINLRVPLTIFNSGSALAMSLANGTIIGQTKYFANRNSGTATITPTTLLNGSTVTVAVDQGCTMKWVGTGWMITENNGAVLA